MKFIAILLGISIIPILVLAQETANQLPSAGNENFFTYLQKQDSASGKVTVHQSAAIEELMNKHLLINEKVKGSPGYRIRIFSDSGNNARNAANQIKSKFLTKYPEVEAYMKYDPPNFKIVIGDFRTKNEATKFLIEVINDFPNAFIVKDLISFPKLN